VKRFGLFVCLLFFCGGAEASPATPVDETDPGLVMLYLGFPCEALDDSYSFQYNEAIHLTRHMQYCVEAIENNPDYKYGKLICVYVEMQWDFMNSHLMAVKRARELMCDDGEPKHPQYKIDF